MIDARYLSDLIPILKLHGVKQIKMQGLELEFGSWVPLNQLGQVPEPGQNATQMGPVPDSTSILADALRKQEEALPPDLRADSLMDQDKILNWSSPDQKPFDEEPELPLTGEAPL